MKKSTIVYILILVLSIVLAGSIGYIIRDKVVDKTDNDNTKTSSTTSVNTQNTDMTSDEKYAQFLKNLKQQREKENIYTSVPMAGSLLCDSTYKWIEITNDGKLILISDRDRKEIDSNVLMAYSGNYGNGGCSSLFYLKEDGSIKTIDKNTDGSIKIEDKNFKNVVSMMTAIYGWETSGASSTLFIDIDGNIVNK